MNIPDYRIRPDGSPAKPDEQEQPFELDVAIEYVFDVFDRVGGSSGKARDLAISRLRAAEAVAPRKQAGKQTARGDEMGRLKDAASTYLAILDRDHSAQELEDAYEDLRIGRVTDRASQRGSK